MQVMDGGGKMRGGMGKREGDTLQCLDPLFLALDHLPRPRQEGSTWLGRSKGRMGLIAAMANSRTACSA